MSSSPSASTIGSRSLITRDQSFLAVFEHYLQTHDVDRTQPVLVVGGEDEDLAILSAVGFQRIVLSNLRSGELTLDAEDIQLPDNSYSVVFAHTVLHHCRCPHKAIGEMVRVARQHVFILDANDSWTFRLLTRLKFSFPYEVGATAPFGYLEGGMRNGPIPNYMYRWTEREVEKCVAAYLPERVINVRVRTYWGFNVYENDLLTRTESRVGKITKRLGPRNFIRLLHAAQAAFNIFPLLRAQGNKFFCAISKGELQPWIEERNGQFYEKRGYKTSLSAPL